MTKYEIMVIAAAVAAFILINIIMWSIIGIREKIARKKNAKLQTAIGLQNAAPAAAPPVQPMSQAAPMYQIPQMTQTSEATQEFPAVQPVSRRPRVKRSDFILLDDVVLVHTDERIEM